MSFNDNVQLDTSQISTPSGGGRGGPGGMVVGGGIGGILVLILALVFGINPNDLPGGTGGTTDQSQSQDTSGSDLAAKCKTGSDANADLDCRIVGTVNSVQAFWSEELPRYGKTYPLAKTVLYSGSTQSPCGTASNQVGPFYCPIDSQVYIDASFFQILESQFGSSGGKLAQEYVVAHEYGHHIQNVLGLLNRAQQDPQGATSGAVKIELMADCLGGVWAHHAATTKDSSGKTFLKPLTDQDVKDALSAAASVGDDRIQQKTSGRVNPETWTHGSAEQRQRWFLQGYKTGDLNQCDTFSATNL